MAVTAPDKDSKEWMRFLRKHWHVLVLFVGAAVSVAVGAVYVFLWFISNAQSTSLVPSTLGQWTANNLITFLLNLIFWELILVGVPVIMASLAGWMWWRRLLCEDREEYHFFDTPTRPPKGGGGAASLLFWIAFSIRIYIDGNWNVSISTWTLDYFVYTSVWTVIWMLILLGIPATIIGIIWWLSHTHTRL